MLRGPKHSKIEVAAPKEEEEEDSLSCLYLQFFVPLRPSLSNIVGDALGLYVRSNQLLRLS
jgi:hypothetical protein